MAPEPLRLTPRESSFQGEAGDELLGRGFWLPEREPPEGAYRFNVAGVSHRREELQGRGFTPGNELTLVPEPDNPHDPDAVGVWDAGKAAQAGYVPRDRARLIRRRLARGKVSRAISLFEWTQYGTGERVGLEVLVVPDHLEIVFADRPS